MALTISEKYLLAQRFRAVAGALTDTIGVIDDLVADYNRTTPEMRTEAVKIATPEMVLQSRAQLVTMRDGLLTLVRNYAGDVEWPVAE